MSTQNTKSDITVYSYSDETMTSVATDGKVENNLNLSFTISDTEYNDFVRDSANDVTVSDVKYYAYSKSATTYYTTDTGYNYATYFSVYDENRKPIFEVQSIVSNGVTKFFINRTNSDKLVVSKNEESATYYFGIKLCETTQGTEDTLFIAGGDFGTLNTITVYPKKAEGIE